MIRKKFLYLTNPVHIIFVIAFLLLVLFSNKIIYDGFKGKDESVVEEINAISVNGKIRYYIDKIEQSTESMKEIVSIKGWAFIEDIPVDEESRITELILASDSNYYKINSLMMNRPDVPKGLGILNLNIDKSGFYARFSEYKIKPGIYRVGIYIKNDKDNEAFNWTDVYLKKEGKRLYKYIGEPIKLKRIPDVNQNIYFDLETPLKNINGYFTISGRASIIGEDASEQEIYVIITDSKNNMIVYPTLPQTQANEIRTSKSDQKSAVEFSANIPIDALSQDVNSINIMMRTGRISGISKKDYKIVRIGNNACIAEDVLPLNDINSSDFALKDTNQYKYYIDRCTFDKTSDNLAIVGWLFRSSINSKENSVYAIFEGSGKSYVFKTYTNKRKDVTAAFNDGSNYDLSGFSVEVYIKFLEDGLYKLYIASDYDEKVKFSTGYSLNVKNDKIEVINN